MEYRFLSKKGVASFVTGLLKEFRVYGPVKKDGFPMYGEIASPDELNLLHTPTHLSPKQYLFPPKETLLKFKSVAPTSPFIPLQRGTPFLSPSGGGQGEEIAPVVEAYNQALFGVHPCDIHAIRLLDRVFAYGTPDANYLKRRERTVIIGIDCLPDKHCFCKSVNTMKAESGFDIFLHDIGSGFLAEIGTQKGKELLFKYTKTRRATLKEASKIDIFQKKKAESFTSSINAEASTLPLLYSGSYSSPVWEKIGKICYGCGSCNNVCPTCYCFDVRDEIKANLTEGERYRVWDACLLEDFAKVAGGHNFRKTRAERLRHRFNRKFQYQVDRFGGLFCVGCGRCIRTCLVHINIVEVTNELIEESNRKP
ncbi:MAG: 4Fe-4S dicluster domain-containing protein [Deltaproteobacteria bacterium]|nr:4Fe-4S dicluster domain-containing protein [Deltaproteobacteria bacterium]